MSAIDHTANFASRRVKPSGRTRIRSQRPCPLSGEVTRTSSCWRLPSRAAFKRRNTASDTSGLPMNTRSTGRTSCAAGGAGQRQIGGVGIGRRDRADRSPPARQGMIGHRTHDRIFGGAVGKADNAGGERKEREQADHGQQRSRPIIYGCAAERPSAMKATAAATTPPAISKTKKMLPPRRAGSGTAANGSFVDGSRFAFIGHRARG